MEHSWSWKLNLIMFVAGNVNDVTLGDESEEEEPFEEEQEREAQVMGNSRSRDMRDMMGGMQKFLDKASSAFEAMATSVKGKKRGRGEDDDEEEEVKSQPKLVRIENHLLEDDAHTIIDWKARFLIRPYNGGDQKGSRQIGPR